MAEDYPRPSSEWVERMRSFRRGPEVGEPIFPGVSGLIDLAKQIGIETKEGIETFGRILQGKSDYPLKMTPMLMGLTGPGAEGLAINRDLAIKQLARLSAQQRKQWAKALREAGAAPETIIPGIKEASHAPLLKKLAKIPQSEWDRVASVGKIERQIPGFDFNAMVVPEETFLQNVAKKDAPALLFDITKSGKTLAKSVPHEFTHIRQFVPEGVEKARYGFMIRLRQELYEGRSELGLTERNVYSEFDPLEMHARNVADRVRGGEEFGSAVAAGLKDMDAFLGFLKQKFPQQYERAQHGAIRALTKEPAGMGFPERPPIRGAKQGMKLRPEAMKAMDKARRGEKLHMERLPDLEKLEPGEILREAERIRREGLTEVPELGPEGRMYLGRGEKMTKEEAEKSFWEWLKKYAPERIS